MNRPARRTDLIEAALRDARPEPLAPGPHKARLAARLRAESGARSAGESFEARPALAFGALAASAVLFAAMVFAPRPEPAVVEVAWNFTRAELRELGLTPAAAEARKPTEARPTRSEENAFDRLLERRRLLDGL